jgi:NAD(P)-dependent dehydrogenase (short-subunit alcohol dehydrogenase family)
MKRPLRAWAYNDAYPIARNEIDCLSREDLRATFEAVVVFPVRLVQQFIPGMKQRRSGSLVFITSAREARPEPGFAVPTTMRAATTAFAKAVAKEVAPFGIQANAVAPNYLYSEMYYPKARFIDSAEGRELIARTVPFGRARNCISIARAGANRRFPLSGRRRSTDVLRVISRQPSWVLPHLWIAHFDQIRQRPHGLKPASRHAG